MSFNTALTAILCLLLVGFTACETDMRRPDVSNITLDNQIVRYDHHFNAMDAQNVESKLTDLAERYPAFSELYMSKILPLKPSTNKEEFNRSVLDFLEDKDVKQLNDTINELFSDFSDTEDKIVEALKYYKHYFPQSQTPNIYTFTSYFGYQSFIFPDHDRDGVAIGLDMFLGDSYPYKSIDPQNPAFSDYLTKFYVPEIIPKRVIEQIIEDKLGPPIGSKFIDHMVHHGKKLYLMKRLLPTAPDHLIHEYTEEQMDWVRQNETGIWTYIVDQELLYGTNNTMINRYTRPAPTSKNMPAESPGRTANFLGLQIVEAFMKAYPNTTLNELISMNDGTEILQTSKYKPPRI